MSLKAALLSLSVITFSSSMWLSMVHFIGYIFLRLLTLLCNMSLASVTFSGAVILRFSFFQRDSDLPVSALACRDTLHDLPELQVL